MWRRTGGGGNWEKRRRDVYEGREVGTEGNNATLRTILQSKKAKSAKRREPTNIGREPGLEGTGSRKFDPPTPFPYGKLGLKWISTLA